MIITLVLTLAMLDRAQGDCMRSTGGTCQIVGCWPGRGPTSCVHGMCMCNEGGCADIDGECVYRNTRGDVSSCDCDRDTGGTCFLLWCNEGRNALCQYPSCVCPADTCAVNGICEPCDASALSAASPEEGGFELPRVAATYMVLPLGTLAITSLLACLGMLACLLLRRSAGSGSSERGVVGPALRQNLLGA